MNDIRSRTGTIGGFITGVLSCAFGGAVALGCGIGLLTLAIRGNVAMLPEVVLLALTVAGSVLLAKGIDRCKLYSLGQKIKTVMRGKNREKLSVLAQIAKTDYTGLVRSLRKLSAQGVFPRAYVDLYRREFVAVSGGPVPPITPGATVLREITKKSALPVYGVAATWLTWALLFPMYRWYDFALAALFSMAVFFIGRRLTPEQTIILEEARKVEPPPKPEAIDTGNTELDEVLTSAMKYMAELTKLDVAISGGEIDGHVQELVYICKQMFDYIKKAPGQVRQLRQFMNYYLPTTIKLLQNYDELSREPLKGENIKVSMTKIEDAMQSIVGAFQRELDNLYQDKAIDISVDIEVMQNMMEQEGFSKIEGKRDSPPDIKLEL